MRRVDKLRNCLIAMMMGFASTAQAHALNLSAKQVQLAQCAVNYKSVHIISRTNGKPLLVKSRSYLLKCLNASNLALSDFNKIEIIGTIREMEVEYPSNSPVVLALKSLVEPLSLKEILIMTLGETYSRIEDLKVLPADLQEAVKLYFPNDEVANSP